MPAKPVSPVAARVPSVPGKPKEGAWSSEAGALTAGWGWGAGVVSMTGCRQACLQLRILGQKQLNINIKSQRKTLNASQDPTGSDGCSEHHDEETRDGKLLARSKERLDLGGGGGRVKPAPMFPLVPPEENAPKTHRARLPHGKLTVRTQASAVYCVPT